MPINLSPFGAIVGSLLLTVASVPLWTETGTNGPTERLHEAERRNDQLAEDLARANARLRGAGLPPVPSTTRPPVTDGRTEPSSTTPTVPDPPATLATVPTIPSTTTAPTVPGSTVPPTTEPPSPPTTDDGCPPGYHPVIVVTIPPARARVCLRD